MFIDTDPSKFAKTTATKAVFGVCVDPQHEEKVASFVENQVSVWDLRWFDKPLHTLPLQKSSIVKVCASTPPIFVNDYITNYVNMLS